MMKPQEEDWGGAGGRGKPAAPILLVGGNREGQVCDESSPQPPRAGGTGGWGLF